MKDKLRKEVLEKRNSLSKDSIIENSKKIKKKLFSSEEYKKAKIICFYVSFGSEVDTFKMMEESLKNKTVCVPIVQGLNIKLSIIKDIKELNKKNKYGILEPSEIREIKKEDVDLVIVPGVVFDKENYRIGYGKGYYDKILEDFKGKKIGLAFKLQVVDKIPKEEHDVNLDMVITK